jgi:uncharacterized membrane-anchored protein
VIDRALVGVGMALAVVTMAGSVAWQERDIARSQTIYLELGPADPRSLVQGDFMRLRYVIERDLAELPAPGEIAVTLDERRVGTAIRPLREGEALGPDEVRMDTFSRERRNTVAPRAYLFEEGTADLYEVAEYGILAVTPEGRTTLVGLADEGLQRLGPPVPRF